jgi:hypothetical protein
MTFLPASFTSLRARAVPSHGSLHFVPGQAAEESSYRNFRDTIEQICATADAVSLERVEVYSLRRGTIAGTVVS